MALFKTPEWGAVAAGVAVRSPGEKDEKIPAALLVALASAGCSLNTNILITSKSWRVSIAHASKRDACQPNCRGETALNDKKMHSRETLPSPK